MSLDQNLSPKEKFFKAHPKCCFCGGDARATTIEHAPPKWLFIDKQIWKGLEFPACKRCNAGSAQQNQFVAFFALAQSLAIHEDEQLLNYAKKLSDGVIKNHKENWPVFDFLDDENLTFRLNANAQAKYLAPWAAKMGLGLWYEQTREIFPTQGRLVIVWTFNGNFEAQQASADFAKNLSGMDALEQGDNNSEEKFAYTCEILAENKGGMFQLILHESCTLNLMVYSDASDIPQRITGNPKADIYKTSKLKGITRVNYENQ